MSSSDLSSLRHSVIAAIVRRHEGIGRTALMKLVYFLQALRGVPLGYGFRIYTYGPYDSQVLDDLQLVEMMGAVRSEQYEYDFGTGYRIMTAEMANEIARAADQKLGEHLDWVVATFGRRSAADLEIASTIVFLDKRSVQTREHRTAHEVAKAVHAMKPHLAVERIAGEVNLLKERGLVQAVA